MKENAAGKSPRESCSCTKIHQKKLTYLGFQYLDHSPYSPDLAPPHYHLFPGLKKQLKGRHCSSDAEVIAAAETWLDGQISEFFFGEACKSYSIGLKSVLSFVLNKSRVWSLLFVSFLVGLRNYQHPSRSYIDARDLSSKKINTEKSFQITDFMVLGIAEMMEDSQLIQKFPHFNEFNSSAPYSQNPTTWSYSQPDNSRLQITLQFIYYTF